MTTHEPTVWHDDRTGMWIAFCRQCKTRPGEVFSVETVTEDAARKWADTHEETNR